MCRWMLKEVPRKLEPNEAPERMQEGEGAPEAAI